VSMDIIDRAYMEWIEDGVVSTSTYIELNQHGFDADVIIEQFESEEIL